MTSPRSRRSRKYLVGMLDPSVAPRLAPAMRAVRALLADGRWHEYKTLADCALGASDVKYETIRGTLGTLVREGMVEKRGEYAYGTHEDHREYRLADWPLPEVKS